MLRIENVTKIFNPTQNKNDERIALDNVSLEIAEGEFVTVIGGNGSGKTTLFNVITGRVPIDNGKIFLDGVDVTFLPEHKRAKYLGIVYQDPLQGTVANMSVIENLLIASRKNKKKTFKWGFNKIKVNELKDKLKDLDLGLENRIYQKIGILSGGQRQAITLLMATLTNPKLLLLDEHTAALDPKTAKIVLDLTEKIVSTNKITTIMVTHNMRDALKYGNRIIMLNNGKVILDVKGEEKTKLTINDLLKKFEDLTYSLS